jgi:hypothetical protein
MIESEQRRHRAAGLMADAAIGEVCVHFPRAGFVVTSP